MEDIKEVCQKAIDKYGKTAQMDMVIEECAELIQAVSKNKRGRDNRNNIVEEIADVELMIEQLKLMFDISEQEVGYWKHCKLQRLLPKMETSL